MIENFKELPKEKIIKKYFKTNKKRQKLANWMVNSIHPKVKSFPRLTTNPIIDDEFKNYISKGQNFQFKCEDISYDKIINITNQIIRNTRKFEDELFLSMIDIKPEERKITEIYLNELFTAFKYSKIICSTGAYSNNRKELGSTKMLNRIDPKNFHINRYDQRNRIFFFLEDFAVLFIGLTINIKMIDGNLYKYVYFEVKNNFKLHIDFKKCKIIETPTINLAI